jgi:pimeloyl-ACP methyl ester carboxylesterase
MGKTPGDPIIFVHGQESSSRGTKGRFFRDLVPEMIIPDFAGDVWTRMAQLNQILSGKSRITMIGSSLGGLMAALFAFQNQERLRTLILLAPALNVPEFDPYLSKRLTLPVTVFHGEHDELIPAEPIQVIAKKVFPNLSFTLLDDDHRLTRTFSTINWAQLLFEQ